MFTKELWEKYADVVAWSLFEAMKTAGGKYTPGNIVIIHCSTDSLLLAETVCKKLIAKGLKSIVKNNNASRLFIVDKREGYDKYGWTWCIVATEAQAQQAGLTVEEYEAEIIKSCYLDQPNPVEAWKKVSAEAAEIRHWLETLKVDRLCVESANIDLRITIGRNRKWMGINGYNMPSFEIYTSPDWRGTSGHYFANTQSLHDGQLARDVKLVFRQGEVIKASAAEGEEFLKSQLAILGARRLGEFSLTDKRFSPISKFMANTLFDENVGQPNGNCHIALGYSLSHTYSGYKRLFNLLKKKQGFNESNIHWDMINTEPKRVIAYLSGAKVVIYEDGQFRY